MGKLNAPVHVVVLPICALGSVFYVQLTTVLYIIHKGILPFAEKIERQGQADAHNTHG